ncbi:MAG: efflux RND transporter permease subunit [Rhizobiales bacterium]|nr:efflux RND transporter permease subunit [Hyphomicrobiales bacterium]NRB15312.1 efflux RND transporter permease subunit [Hyphomicrobiales bacterium]
MSTDLQLLRNKISKKGIIRLFVRHHTAANLLMAMLILLGGAALLKLNTQLMPTFTINYINISTSWSGASPDDVEASILRPLEAEVRFLSAVEKVTAYATEGNGGITIQFESDADMTVAMSAVERAVASVRNLPAEADAPIITKIEFFEPVASISVSGPFGERALIKYTIDIRDGLLEAGIDKIDFSGKRDQEIAVNVDPLAIEKTNLSLGDIARKIATGTLDRPSGTLEGTAQKSLRMFGVGQSASDLGGIELNIGTKGERLLLSDIANIDTQYNPDQTVGVMANNRAIVLEIKRAPSADTLKTMEIMHGYLAEVKATLPKSLDITTFNVTGEYVRERINLLVSNGLSGLVLVVLVLFVFLNARIAFWVAAGVPVAIMATLAVMYLFGTSINMISMFALIMMLGIIVDDAIVVAEEAETQMRNGLSPMDAAQLGATRMMKPVIAAALTTIAAFLPLAMIGGFMGQVMITFPIVVISVLIASLIECFLILPGHLRHVKYKGRGDKRNFFRRYFDNGFEFFRDKMFVPVAAFSFRWRWATVAGSFATFIVAVGFITSNTVGFDFFPQAEGEEIQLRVEFSSGADLDAMKRDVVRLEDTLREVELNLGGTKNSLVETVYTSISGGTDPEANIRVQLTKAENRDVRTSTILDAWQDAAPVLPTVENLIIQENRGGSGGAEIDYRLSGGSLAVLKTASRDMQEQMSRLPGVSGLDDNFPVGKRELILELTPRGGALGFTIDNISGQLRNNFQGLTARSFPTLVGDVDVKVQLAEQEGSMSSLRNFRLKSPTGKYVQLSEIVTFEERVGASLIRKTDGKISITVTGEVNPDLMTGDEVRAEIEKNILPGILAKYGIEHTLGGQGLEQAEAFLDMQIGAILGLSLIYITLAWVFASYTRPFVVMMIIPFGFVGALFGHYVMGFNLTMMSIFGLLGLAGILVNDSIILVSRIDEYIEAGADMYHAAVMGAKDRLRAVLLTSLTTMGGLTPLMFEKSLQAQFLIPLAITMVFGLLAATVLVLILVPATIGLMQDIGNFFSWVWNGREWRHFTKRVGIAKRVDFTKRIDINKPDAKTDIEAAE